MHGGRLLLVSASSPAATQPARKHVTSPVLLNAQCSIFYARFYIIASNSVTVYQTTGFSKEMPSIFFPKLCIM